MVVIGLPELKGWDFYSAVGVGLGGKIGEVVDVRVYLVLLLATI